MTNYYWLFLAEKLALFVALFYAIKQARMMFTKAVIMGARRGNYVAANAICFLLIMLYSSIVFWFYISSK